MEVEYCKSLVLDEIRILLENTQQSILYTIKAITTKIVTANKPKQTN